MKKEKAADQWKPSLEGKGALHDQIVLSLERDIRRGILANGTRLPPYRILANQLGVSLGTVAKAYVLAEQRGLVRGHVGKGTFVLGAATESAGQRDDQIVDMSLNVVPHAPAVPYFAEYRQKTLRYSDMFEALAYGAPMGAERARRAASSWLKRIANFDTDWSRLVLTAGAQHAIALVLGAICKPQDSILCESATFYGLKSLAAHSEYGLCPVQMDEEGIRPDELRKAVKLSKAKVIYLQPTAQNPTGRTMRDKRRAEIVGLARRHDLWVVEDDLYSLFADRSKQDLTPLAALAPERSFYIGGTSKSVAPGLRLGFLACPDERMVEAITAGIRATMFSVPLFGADIFRQWVEDDAAFRIADSVKQEIKQRWILASDLLGSDFEAHGVMPHVWLPMSRLAAEQLSGRALRAGVSVTSPDAPIPSGSSDWGLRVCLGTPANIGQVRTGLQRLASVLAPATPQHGGVI